MIRTPLLLFVAACSASSASPPAPASGIAPPPPSLLPPLPSTETPEQAMGTLAAEIPARAREVATRTLSYPELVGDLLAEAGVTGRLDDYVRADAASARWVEVAPGDPDAHVTRAKLLATLHRFAEARAELDRARAAGANASTIALRQVDLDQATGVLDDAIAAREETARLGPNLVSLTMLALAKDERGDAAAGLALMPKALATWHDVSAIPFTWFLFQWGRLAEDSGDEALARAAYAEAWKRLPRYGEAGRHLAALDERAGDDASASKILDALDAADPHPETTAMRAELAARAHDPRAAQLLADARAGWERYLAAFPAAFSDHAARFFLGAGRDPARALALAEANLANRDTAEAAALVIDAALAAGDAPRACEVAAHLIQLGPAPRRHRFTAWKAFATCGRTADADRLARELGISSP